MSEYIIKAADWAIDYKGESLFKGCEEIVRCRDCVKFSEQEPNSEIGTCNLGLEDTGLVSIVEPDGFCSWAERADNFATCKCGEDIETNGRESVTCPSCGRVITE